FFPGDVLCVVTFFQLFEERRDEVEAGLDGEDLTLFDDAREPKVRMPFRFRNGRAARVGHESGDVVDLQSDEVTDAVREEGAADAALDDGVGVEAAHE